MKLLLDRERATEIYPNPHDKLKPNKQPNSKHKTFLVYGFEESIAICWLFPLDIL